MALPTNWFEPLANGGFGDWLAHGYLRLHGAVHPYYVMSALYLTVFSIGEAFYSPRVYEYAAAIAPKGQEASYGALAYLPFLIGKLLVGTSGWILARFCPATGPRRSPMSFKMRTSCRGAVFFGMSHCRWSLAGWIVQREPLRRRRRLHRSVCRSS